MAATCRHPRDLLDETAEPDLSAWYASPLDPGACAELLAATHATQQRLLALGTTRAGCAVAQLIGHYWQGLTVAADRQRLQALFARDEEQALLELVYGQLLMATKRRGARYHLARGFLLATPYLSARGYLQVWRRHDTLGRLSLTEHPQPARELEDLLIEARVIQRLSPRPRPGNRGSDRDPRDTLG